MLIARRSPGLRCIARLANSPTTTPKLVGLGRAKPFSDDSNITESVLVRDLVETAIANNVVAIFSKSTCSFCARTKDLFQSQFPDVQTAIIELDQRKDRVGIQRYLKERTGQRTVPNVFINQKHIGGHDTVFALHAQGKLAGLVHK